MIRHSFHHRRGVALIPALLVLSIVASSAALLNLGQQVWIRQVENVLDRAQADEISRAALAGAVVVLEGSRFSDATPEALADLSRRVVVPDVAGGTSEVSIVSAQGFFNLNNLLRGSAPSPEDVAIFRRLLVSAGLEPDLSDAVLDWMDADDDRRSDGAESWEYLARLDGYRAANRPFDSVDELVLIKGFDAKAVEKLLPLVSALPEYTPVDANAAPAPVLSALFDGVPPDLAQRLIASRTKSPFQNAFDFGIRAGKAPAAGGTVGFKSLYFLVRADGQQGRARRKTISLVQCPPGFGTGRVLWRTDVF